MEPFEYVSVLSSIILGLGITQILTGLSATILESSRVRIYIPHLTWVVVIFGLHIQEWWIYFDYSREIRVWRMMDFFLIVIYPIILFIMARLLFPSFGSRKQIDLKNYYYANYRKIFLLGLFLPVLSIPQNILILNLPITSQGVPILLAILFLTGLSMRGRHAWFHYMFSLLVLVVGLFYLLWFDPQL